MKKGIIYIGYYDRKRKNGLLKIGQTRQTIGTRANQISKNSNSHFSVLKIAEFDNISKAELDLIESVVRREMEKVKGLKHIKNDHFEYTIDRTSNQLQIFLRKFDESIDKAKDILYN